VPARVHRRRDAAKSAETSWLDNHFMQLAAVAWMGYQKDGRGMVVVIPTVRDASDRITRATLSFMPLATVPNMGSFDMPALRKRIEQYDPEQQVVAIFANSPFPGSYTLRHPDINPPDAPGRVTWHDTDRGPAPVALR